MWMALSTLVSLDIRCTPSGPSIVAEGPSRVLQPMAKTLTQVEEVV